MPRWNFERSEDAPCVEEAPGDHYEETNSIGPTAEEELVGSMARRIEWAP